MEEPKAIAETIVLLLAAGTLLAWLSQVVRVPYPVALVLGGIALGFVPGIPEVPLDPDLVLLLFVAPLLYAEAFFAPVAELRRNARSIALLSLLLVVVTAGAAAVVAHAVLGMSWGVAFALGAALAATDAVAPVQVLGREGVDPRLVAVVQGESLFNDGVAFTLVKVAAAAVVTGSFSLLGASGEFLLVVAGGVAAGIAVAALVAAARRRTSDTLIEAGLSLLTPFAAYIAAESVHASGILAAVAAGLWLGQRNYDMVEPMTRVEIQAAWEIATFVLNALLFLLVGLQLQDIAAAVELPPERVAAGAAALVVALIGIRLLWALTLPSAWSGARRMAGRGRRESSRGWRFALAWSGVRGAVALAAALSLPATIDGGGPFPDRDLVILVTLIVIVVTLVGQGLTLRPALRRLGLTNPHEAAREQAVAQERAADAALESLDAAADRHGLSGAGRAWLEREYTLRRERFAARAHEGGDEELEERSRRVRETDHELLDSAREAVLELEARGEVRADIAQRVLRDLDLDAARLDEPPSE